MKRFSSIADARRYHCVSQQQLAAAIGVSRGAVSLWEMRKGTRPDPSNALRLVEQLPGLTLDVIYRQHEEKAA